MRFRSAAVAVLLAVAAVGAAAAPAATQQAEGEAYSGAFVTFEATDAAVADYEVDGSVVVENVTVQSASETDGGIDAGLGAVTSVNGSGLSVSTGDAGATLTTESGAKMEANDNKRGVLQVRANGESQVVQAEVSGQAESESDKRVVVRNDDGTEGAFLVVGDGEATTDDDGDVVARIEGDGQLVYRQYEGERSDDDESQEQMIQDGTAAAEVYVHSAAESGDEAESEGTSVVHYSEDTTVEVTERSESEINMTAERGKSEGAVIITTVSEEAFGSAESTEVFVDGEAAAEAESYSEVQDATEGADNSRYLVRQSASAEAATDVVVGVNHFSERSVSMQRSGDGGDGITADGPGFGVLVALAALGAAFVAARYGA
jgi:PGF-CTERM protein